MKKIFLISDSPYATTGLGRLTRGFLKMYPDYHWIIWGTSHPRHLDTWGKLQTVYEPTDFNGNFTLISPTVFAREEGDIYAFQNLEPFLREYKPDILLSAIDANRLQAHSETIKKLKMAIGFDWISYFPVDREFVVDSEPGWLRFPDKNIMYASHGISKYRAFDKNLDIDSIYLPVDSDDYPEVNKKDLEEFKKSYYSGNLEDDTFLVGSVNRSFARKDPVSSIYAFSKFNKKVKNAKLYMHGGRLSVEGHDLARIANYFKIKPKNVMFPPDRFSEVNGVEQEKLNLIYRTFDLFITSSMGEGFGYSTAEALLTETPIIAPDNTTFPELIQDHGYLVPVKDWNFFYNLYDLPWSVVDRDKMAKQMKYVYDNYDEAKEKAKKGRQWVLENLSYEAIKKQWDKYLT